jgi:hypothetical protein
VSESLGAADCAVLAVNLGAIIAISAVTGRRQKTREDALRPFA